MMRPDEMQPSDAGPQALIEQSVESDIQDLLTAKENAKRRMLEDPTPANVAAFEKVRDLLDRILGERRSGAESSEKRFEKISDVVKYLKDEGYKVGKSKVYQDAKAGFLTGDDTLGYTLEAVLAYAHTQMLEKVSTGKSTKIDRLTEVRLEKEVEKLTEQVKKLQFELSRDQGKYLLKEDVRTELAQRIAAFEAAFKHLVRTSAAEWVEMVAGDQSMTDRMAARIYGDIDAMLNEMAVIDELDLVVRRKPVAACVPENSEETPHASEAA